MLDLASWPATPMRLDDLQGTDTKEMNKPITPVQLDYGNAAPKSHAPMIWEIVFISLLLAYVVAVILINTTSWGASWVD
jgi:hypothetical protein